MSNFGNSGNPGSGSGYYYDDFGNCQFWSDFGTFPGGTITDVYVFVDGHNQNPSGELCLWSNGSLVWNSGSFNFGTGPNPPSIGGQSWQHQSGVNLTLAGGNDLSIGYWTSGHVQWTYLGTGGGTQFQRGLGGPADQNSGGQEGNGELYAYVAYSPGVVSEAGVYVFTTGGTWSRHPLNVLKPNGQWHWRGVQTLGPDGNWHWRG